MSKGNVPDFGDMEIRGLISEWFRGLDGGDKAELRRCTDVVETAFVPAFSRLRFKRTGDGRMPFAGDGIADQVAAAAIVVAHLPDSSADAPDKDLGAVMATPRDNGERPPVGEARLKRLLHAEQAEEVSRTLRRLIQLAGGERVSPAAAGATAFRLAHPYTAREEKRRLALRYYGAVEGGATANQRSNAQT